LGVYAAVFSATTGANLTAEFRVNTYTTNTQRSPAICALTADTFAVAWESVGQDGSGFGVYAAVFNATTGANLMAEFRVNTYTASDQENPAVSALTADTFAVTWQSNGQDGSGYGVYAAVFDRLNAPLLDSISPTPSVDGTIQLTWSAVPVASWYYVFRATTPITDITGMVAIATTTDHNFTDTVENGEYFYVIVAGHTLGNSSLSNCENITVLNPPASPFLVLILPEIDEDGIVELKWSKIPKSTTYYLFRDTSYILSTEGLMPIAAVTGTNYTDHLLNNDYYYYAVVAGDGWVNSSVSNCQYVLIARGGDGAQPDYTLLFILSIVAGFTIAAAIIVHGFLMRAHPSSAPPPEKRPPVQKPKM
jgi:methionine-rich copper-binding protein CopC